MKQMIKRAALLLPMLFMTMMNAPVHAAQSDADHTLVRPSQTLHVPVVFHNCASHESESFMPSLTSTKVEPYSTGYLVAYTLDNKAHVEVGGKYVDTDLKCLAITDEDKKKLKDLQDEEIREQKKREDALAKVNAAKGASNEVVDMKDLDDEEVEVALKIPEWNGSVLTPSAGVNMGPSGKETYYNLPMGGVISIMRSIGNTDEYWVRDDGVKMLGDYVMVAAHLPTRPRGSLIPTSLGMGIVCDTGTFALNNHTQLDIAVAW